LTILTYKIFSIKPKNLRRKWTNKFMQIKWAEFGDKSRQYHIADDFLYFCHRFAWKYIGILMSRHHISLLGFKGSRERVQRKCIDELGNWKHCIQMNEQGLFRGQLDWWYISANSQLSVSWMIISRVFIERQSSISWVSVRMSHLTQPTLD